MLLPPLLATCCPPLCHAPHTQTGEYSINLLLWHKHLLYNEEHHTLRERQMVTRAGACWTPWWPGV